MVIIMSQFMKALTFSYDDGVTTDERLIEIFNRYGMKCTFNLNTGRHPASGERPSWKVKEATIGRFLVGELPEIYKGHEVAVHSLTHPHLEAISEDECRRELVDDIDNIEKIFGKKPVGMAYPYGSYNDTVVRLVGESGLRYARGTNANFSFDVQTDLLRFRPTCHHKVENLMDLARDFVALKPETPKIFYVWGHSYEFAADNNWDIIERFCEFMAGRDDIFYGTNEQVLL